jgi:hypothetical protein
MEALPPGRKPSDDRGDPATMQGWTTLRLNASMIDTRFETAAPQDRPHGNIPIWYASDRLVSPTAHREDTSCAQSHPFA